MKPPAAITGDYVNLKFIPSRNVAQVIVEIPIEAGNAFVTAFGTPQPTTGVPIALARLVPGLATTAKAPGGPLARRAGILCNEGAFQKWMTPATNADEAAELLRIYCGVKSRAELDHNNGAARRFHDLETSYKAWMAVA